MPQPPSGNVRRAISLVCIAHFFSHFNLMMLPPLLPLIGGSLRIGYTEIGLALTAYSLASALTQTPVGFAVDRFGAPLILIVGMAIEGLSFVLIGLMPGYGIFVGMLVLAGIGNSVYHPADYSILNQVVPSQRMGKAFSYHTAAGLAGEAAAPVCVLVIALAFGWHAALIVGGMASVVVALVLYQNRGLFGTLQPAADSSKTRTSVTTLLSPPIVLGLLFFVGISLTSRGVNGFSVSALHEDRDMNLATAGMLLTIWLVAAPIGVLAGGHLADRHNNHGIVIAASFLGITFCLSIMALFQPTIAIAMVLFAAGGFLSGLVSPSRDMLIRSVTPPGQTGKVFGFVSTGFNIGGMLAPPLYGYILDAGKPNAVFSMAALASLLTIATVLTTSRVGNRRVQAS